MRTYYFIGDKTNGVDLPSKLEDISRQRQIDKFGKVCIIPQQNVIEGTNENRVYFLKEFKICYCDKNSRYGVFIRLIGKKVKLLDNE